MIARSRTPGRKPKALGVRDKQVKRLEHLRRKIWEAEAEITEAKAEITRILEASIQ
jgi:hypothetical protein